MKKIKIIVLVIFFSLFFVACDGGSGSSPVSPDIIDSPAPSGETRTLSAIPESLSFAYGETDFKISQVTSKGTGKYSASSNNKSVAEVYINSVGLVRVRPTGVGNAEVTIVRAKDSSYDSASQTIKISVNKQEQNLKVNLVTTASDRWKLSNGATATISVAARSVGGVKGDSTLVGSKGGYSITKIESSTTGDQEVVTAVVDEAGEIIITAESIGDATVTVSNAGDSNYNEDDVTIFITVNDATTQTVLDFTNTGDTSTTDITYGAYSAETDKNITVTGGSAGDFSVKSSNTEIVTAVVDTNGGLITITPKSAGTAVITVTRQGGDSGGITYNPISKDIRVSINKPVAEILSTTTSSFSSITYNKLDDTDDSVVSGSSSAGDYYIKSSKPDVATASITALGAITVLFEQVGTTDITITRAGDYGYRLSSAATIAVKIIKAAQTLAASSYSISATYTEGTDTTSITITGGEGTGNFDTPTSTPDNNVVDITRTSITPSGTLTIALGQGGTTNIIVLKRGDRNYEDSNPLEIGVTINQAPQTISIFGGETSFQQQLGSKDPVTVAILGAKGTGDYTIDSNSNSAVASADFDNNNNLTLTLGVIGSTVIEFSRNGDRNYADSNSIIITVEVTTQANQVLDLGISEFSATYQTTIPAQTTTISTNAIGDGDYTIIPGDNTVATVAVANGILTVTFVNAGKTTILVSRAGNANFNRSRTIPITVTITQASQEIAVATTDVTLSYGETFETTLSGGLAGYEIESIEPEGVVSASIGGSNSDELTIEAIGSGTAEIKVFASGNRNYAQSESKLINFTVNRAAQELTASPSTFSLVYGETATSTITTNTASFADEGEYVVSNNTNIVTTDINQESGILSLRAVGVTDTTVTITITKQQDIRYEAATIEIAITKVIRSDQPLASSVIGRLSFDKPGDTTTVTISDGLSNVAYTVINDNTNIVTAAIIDGSLSITAVAAGDAAVTVQRATGDNYSAADLTIQVRVKTQQTLSLVGSVPSLNYKYDEDQRVVTIAGGQGTGLYQASYNPAGIVTTDVDANGVLFITTVSTGDTIIDIYKTNDESYSQSNTISLSLNVARGVVPLEYETDATTIEYHPTNSITIDRTLPAVAIEPSTNFEYTYTTRDNIAVNGAKIGVRLDTANNVVVSTLNADDAPATITVTRARTPYYEASEADVSVRVAKAKQPFLYAVTSLALDYQSSSRTLIVDASLGNNSYRADLSQADIVTADILTTGALTISPLTSGSVTLTITRNGNRNYEEATFEIQITVNPIAQHLGYGALSGVLYPGGPKVTVDVDDMTLTDGGNFSITYEPADGTIVTADIDTATGRVTITPIGIGDATITVNRAGNKNYFPISLEQRVQSNTIEQVLTYRQPIVIDRDGGTVSIEPLARTQDYTGSYTATTQQSTIASVAIDSEGVLTITPNPTATAIGDATVSITALKDNKYQSLSISIDIKIRVTKEGRISTSEWSSENKQNLLSFGYTQIRIEDATTLSFDSQITTTDVTFAATSSNLPVVRVPLSASNLRIIPFGVGDATVTITASRPGRLDVVLVLRVQVLDLQLALIDSKTGFTLNPYSSATTALLDATTYLFTAGKDLSVDSVSANGQLTSAGGVSNVNVNSVISSKIGGITYLFAASRADSKVYSYQVATSDGALTLKDTTSDNDTLQIKGTSALATAVIADKIFLFVAGVTDDGVSVFEVTDTGTLTYKTSISDNSDLQISGTSSLTTVVRGSKTFLVVAGAKEGFSIFELANDGSLSQSSLLWDILDFNIKGTSSLTTIVIGARDFLFIASAAEAKGISNYEILSDGTPFQSSNYYPDDATLNLQGASSVTTLHIPSKGISFETNYLFVAGAEDHGVSVFSIDNDSALSQADGSGVNLSISDDATLKLRGASSVTTATIGDKFYLFVVGALDHSVSVFEVK